MFIPGNISLFSGIDAADIQKLLSCMAYRQVTVRKGEYVMREGDAISSLGIVLSGAVQIIRHDHEGKRVIQAEFGQGSVFAESLVCAGIGESPVGVVASEGAEILFLPYRNIITPCGSACAFHTRLIENLMRLIARKNLMLTGKLEITSKRTIREKLLAYLEGERARAGTDTFEVPFNRNELADFLCVDRSALSRELGNLRDEGLVGFERNSFTLVRKNFFV